jgi:hypothetical protein
MRQFFILLILLLLAACRPTESSSMVVEAATTHSAWGVVQTFGYAEQADAPPLLVLGEDIIGVWVSADERDTYHTLRRLDLASIQRDSPNPLSILTTFPQSHQFAPAARGLYHLMWLDAHPDAPLDGLYLWSLLINDTPEATRGAFIHDNLPAYHYNLLPNPDGSVWAFITSEPIAEPSLYTQYFDSLGRARSAVNIAHGVNYPSVIRFADGSVRVFWQSVPEGRLMSAAFNPAVDSGVLDTPYAHVAAPRLQQGMLQNHLHITADSTFIYAFWNVSHLTNGHTETWFSVAPIADLSAWTPPALLEVSIGDETYTIAWASPAKTDSPPSNMVMAVQVGQELGVIYWEDGTIQRYESVIALPSPVLLGLPSLYMAIDGRLTLAWAQPTPIGAALNITRQPR